MENLLFINLTLSEQEELSGGNSNMKKVRIRQSNRSRDVKKVVNLAWETTSTNGTLNTSVFQSNSITGTEANTPVLQANIVTVT